MHSICLSIWGWNTIDSLILILNILFSFFINSATNYGFLSKITLFSNPCNFHTLFLNNLTNSSTDVSSVITTKCVILNNLLHTTKIAFFLATNGNFVINLTIKYINSFSSILFAINFSTSITIWFFILWYKLYLFTYFSIYFITPNYQ